MLGAQTCGVVVARGPGVALRLGRLTARGPGPRQVREARVNVVAPDAEVLQVLQLPQNLQSARHGLQLCGDLSARVGWTRAQTH